MIAFDRPGGTSRRSPDRNVLGGELIACSRQPLTGFFRDGCCHTGPDDAGVHTVCALMCAGRWLEAAKAGRAPPVVLQATHEKTLEIVPLELLQRHAAG